MLIRFLPQLKSTKPHRLIETLLNQPTTHLLVCYPELAIALTESLVFKMAYNFGYLAFEEHNIPDKYKYQIISHFEKTFLAGLSADQYQSCWFEHRDQQRLRLYFFIPTIELTTRKRINLYYDPVDRPLCEAFQHAINLHYGLTAPDDLQKRQTHKVGNNIPENTKTIIRALNGLIEDAIQKGKIHHRTEMLQFLEEHGFEIAGTTSTTISIKNGTEPNIRLRGAIYEQDFRLDQTGRTTRKTKTTRDRESHRREIEHSWERLYQQVGRKLQENRRRFTKTIEANA